MHDTFFRCLVILQDGWQNIALVILLADRATQRRRTRRLMREMGVEG